MSYTGTAACLLAATGLLLGTAARAEYRAYELEVVDLYDCRANKRDPCRSTRLATALDPEQYLLTHGGPYHVGVLLLATWMCYGDTSTFRGVCPRPIAREPRFEPGETVRIGLEKHITEGWRGQVEVAYYQASVRSNVYGVRFPERRHVYARYYEKDLRKPEEPAAAAPGTPPGQGTAGPAAAAGAPPPPQGAPPP
jgi:hypothetical protein